MSLPRPHGNRYNAGNHPPHPVYGTQRVPVPRKRRQTRNQRHATIRITTTTHNETTPPPNTVHMGTIMHTPQPLLTIHHTTIGGHYYLLHKTDNTPTQWPNTSYFTPAPTTWQPTSITPPHQPTTQTPTFDGRKAGRMGGAHFVKFEKIVLDREMS